MPTSTILSGLRAARLLVVVTRNIAAEATDPVQQLFLQKIREYKQKSAGGKFVDPSPAIVKEMTSEYTKLDKNYGGGPGVDMTAFPSFKFEEPKLDPIDEAVPVAKAKKK